ncbi:MAG: nSTAND1 domain-containing NTPase [Nitrospira sp.]
MTTASYTLRNLLAQHLSQGQELILFVDQFEEVFTSGFTELDIQTLLEQLLGTVQDAANRLRVVATIRSEFLGKLEAYKPTLNLLNSPYRYHLGPVSPRMLQDMVERPAEATGYTFGPGLVERILQDTGQEPGNLALVEYALKQLFERRKGRMFTVEAYEAVGGVVGAIATKANDVWSGLEDEVRGAFDAVFAELVHLERERPPTRRRAVVSTFG